MKRKGRSRLVTRVALSSLVAFLAVGAILSVVVSRQLRGREEGAAMFHAQFVADSILSREFTAADLRVPMAVTDAPYQRVLADTRKWILRRPVVRIKVWSADGTVVFSDEPRLVGMRFDVDSDLKSGFAGKTTSEVTDLRDAENVFERTLAPKLFATYTPLYLSPDRSGPPEAVAELYQDYAGIQSQINQLFRELALAVVLGLAALYALLFPIVRRASRTLAEQNAKLQDQAVKLEELLATEQQTVAELRELNRLKDEFVSVASHELRTPLTSIIGYAKTLRHPGFAKNAAARDEFLEAIERQGDRLHRLVRNLLAASNIQDEDPRLTFEPIVLAELVQDIAAGLGEAGGRIRLEFPHDLPAIVSDRRSLELILSNLVENALKFSSPAPCEVGARRDDGSVLLWVRDEGIGIAGEQLERIFDPFYQVDSSFTRRYGGVGLGLGLVKSLVEKLRGTIEVQSEPGQGSVFSVRVPLVAGDSPSSDGDGAAGRDGPPATAGIGQRAGSVKSTLRSFDSA